MKKQILYSYQNNYPKPLPDSIMIGELTYTSLNDLSDIELNNLGFSGPFYIPDGFNDTKKIEYDPVNQTLTLRDLSFEEKMEGEDERWKNIREIRDKLLKETDGIVIKYLERDELVLEQYLEYRKKLRDIPQTYNYTWEVIFPTLSPIFDVKEVNTDENLT